MGVTSLSGLQGSVTIPKLTAAATNYWLATEATTITESQQTLGQLALSPKTVGAYTEISRLLLLQSSPSADALVQSDLAQVVALAVDSAVLSGSGASGQPQGIIGSAGVGSVTGTSIAYAGIVEFQTDTASGNALFDSSGYVTTPAVAGLLKQRVKFTSTASPIWEGKLLEGTVDGYRAMASLQVPTANILFGDFSKVVLAEWGVLEVEVNPYANFQAGIIGIRAMYSIDVGVRYGAAFSLATSVT
jgi:HK97 family phage major capsid protein